MTTRTVTPSVRERPSDYPELPMRTTQPDPPAWIDSLPDPVDQCSRCGRTLRSALSKRLAMGHRCADKTIAEAAEMNGNRKRKRRTA